MSRLKFTVDAKLLRELGERLVGRPHMALAELIKNSYDADARHVFITFADDSITIVDDGHGMTEDDFKRRWMRIGTTEKNSQAVSPVLRRTLTGSKGVGRLAVQLLARELELTSVALVEPTKRDLNARDRLADGRLARQISADIAWPQALLEKELTDVSVEFHTRQPRATFANGSKCGTSVVLRDLADTWDAMMFQRLAQEIWALQPPFAVAPDADESFEITLVSPDRDVTDSFEKQMSAIFDIATATVTGQLIQKGTPLPDVRRFPLPAGVFASDAAGDVTRGKTAPTRHLLVKVKLRGSKGSRFLVEIPDCQLADVDYEIRVFDLNNRQPSGVKVQTARDYLSQFGGVHIYDNGFRLPYYGPDQDWLRIEIDHAHRLSRSQLLPEDLQRKNALHDLPNNNRLFGFANVATSAEQRAAEKAGRRPGDALAIQVTRDRLVPNRAYDQLRSAVRVGVDLYAIERARSKVRDATTQRKRRVDPTPALARASEVVETLRPRLPQVDFQTLRDTLDIAIEDVSARRRESVAYAALLGALATAGMTSLAYEHEISKQRAEIEKIARKLRGLARKSDDAALAEALDTQAVALDQWAQRAERIRSLFRPLLDEESRTEMDRYKARKLVADVATQMEVLGRGAEIDYEAIPKDLQLPLGGYAAWSAVFQNLLTNAFRATQAAKPRLIRVDAGIDRKTGWIRVQDNGEGVDLAGADRLFEPFERGVEHDSHAEALGLGGSGLGLSIVKMMLDELGASARFEPPESGWATAVRIDWKEPT